MEPSAALAKAVSGHLSRRTSACSRWRSSCATHWLAANNFLRLVTKLGATLLKWQLMSLTEFDWVLFTDMDVDVMPLSLSPHGNAAIAGDWDRTLREAQRAESIRLVVNADWSSPVNTGVMLLRPSLDIYLDGIEVLNAPFDTSKGWNMSGSPAQLLGSTRLLHMDGTQMLYRGQPAKIDHAQWDFVGADIDQGFFTYMLLARHPFARYARPPRLVRNADGTLEQHVFHHHWGPGLKPWQRIVAYQANNTASDEELCQSVQWIHDGVLNAGGSSSPAVGDDAGMLGRELERPSCSSRFVRVALAMEDQLCRRRAACRASGGGGSLSGLSRGRHTVSSLRAF